MLIVYKQSHTYIAVIEIYTIYEIFYCLNDIYFDPHTENRYYEFIVNIILSIFRAFVAIVVIINIQEFGEYKISYNDSNESSTTKLNKKIGTLSRYIFDMFVFYFIERSLVRDFDIYSMKPYDLYNNSWNITRILLTLSFYYTFARPEITFGSCFI